HRPAAHRRRLPRFAGRQPPARPRRPRRRRLLRRGPRQQQRHLPQRPGRQPARAADRARHPADRPLRPRPAPRPGPAGRPAPPAAEPDQIIRARVAASPSNRTLFLQNPAYKLQVVLEIAQTLARTLEMEPLLGNLLDHLLRLFPQADRGLVLLCEDDRLVLRALRGRRTDATESAPYSRTVVRRALEEGEGILSQDVSGDPKLVLSQTLMALNLRSFLCVPLIAPGGRRQGVIQLDCSTAGMSFRDE